MPYYTFAETFDIDAFVKMLARAAKAFPGFSPFDGASIRTQAVQGLKTLPDRQALVGLEIVDATIGGRLPLKLTTPTDLARLLARVKQLLKGQGAFAVSVDFGRQSGAWMADIKLESDVWHLGFITSYSGLTRGRRQVLIAHSIELASLPLKLKASRGKYTLEHARGGSLWLSATEGLDGVSNPYGFLCEVTCVDEAELVGRFHKLVQAHVDYPVYHEWNAGPQFEDGVSVTPEPLAVYDLIREANLPTSNGYALSLTYRLSDVAGIESLRALCTGKARLVNAMGAIVLDRGKLAKMEALTQAAGHTLRIQLAKSDAKTAKMIATKLKRKLAS